MTSLAEFNAPNRAFETRLRAAMLMLRSGGDPDEIRQTHGLIVLREARRTIRAIDEERSKARPLTSTSTITTTRP